MGCLKLKYHTTTGILEATAQNFLHVVSKKECSLKKCLDYYPFGSTLPGRNYNQNEYKYGFQGQEKDDEIKGEGNSVNYKYRMHDARIGRFLSLDPLASEYPHNSPYAFSENRVIDGVEFEGLEFVDVTSIEYTKEGKLKITAAVDVKIKILNISSSNMQKEILQSNAERATRKMRKALKQVGVHNSKLNPLNLTDTKTNVEYHFSIRSIETKVVESVEDFEPGDMVVLLVDEIHKSSKPPKDQIKNPWVNPGGYAGYEEAISVIEFSIFNDKEKRTVVHEIFHNWGIEHSNHNEKGLMSYKDLTSLHLQNQTKEELQLHLGNLTFQAVTTNKCRVGNCPSVSMESVEKSLNGKNKVDYEESKLK